jgi:hypothetical protein
MSVSSIMSPGNAPTLSYPCLCITKNLDCIVLFTGYGVGTVVHRNGSSSNHLGMFSDDWNMDFFQPYNGKLTLSNG